MRRSSAISPCHTVKNVYSAVLSSCLYHGNPRDRGHVAMPKTSPRLLAAKVAQAVGSLTGKKKKAPPTPPEAAQKSKRKRPITLLDRGTHVYHADHDWVVDAILHAHSDDPQYMLRRLDEPSTTLKVQWSEPDLEVRLPHKGLLRSPKIKTPAELVKIGRKARQWQTGFMIKEGDQPLQLRRGAVAIRYDGELVVTVLDVQRRHARLRFVDMGVLGAQQRVTELVIGWEGASAHTVDPALSVSLKLERELRWNDIPLKLRMAAASGKNRFSTAGNVDLSALTTASTRFSTVRSERRSSTDDAAVATIAAEDAERSRARVGFHAAPGQAWG